MNKFTISSIGDISQPVLELAAFSLLGKFYAAALSAAKSIAFEEGFGVDESNIDAYNEAMAAIEAVEESGSLVDAESVADAGTRLNFWLAAAEEVTTACPSAADKQSLAKTAKFFVKGVFDDNRVPSEDQLLELAMASGLKTDVIRVAQEAKVKRAISFQLPLIQRALEIASDHRVTIIDNDPRLDEELAEKVQAGLDSAKLSAVKTRDVTDALATLMLIRAEESLI